MSSMITSTPSRPWHTDRNQHERRQRTAARPAHHRQRRRRAADVPRCAHWTRRSRGARGRKPGAAGRRRPTHAHHLQEESPTVQEGRIGYRLAGGPDLVRRAGSHGTFAPGQTHRFWNAGDGVLRCSGRTSPPDTWDMSSPRYSHRCSAAVAARIRSTRRTCSGATGRRSSKATSRHRSASWYSRSCAPWVDS